MKEEVPKCPVGNDLGSQHSDVRSCLVLVEIQSISLESIGSAV